MYVFIYLERTGYYVVCTSYWFECILMARTFLIQDSWYLLTMWIPNLDMFYDKFHFRSH